MEVSSTYTPCLHLLRCLPVPRALLQVEKDRQGTWTTEISMQHKTANKKREECERPSWKSSCYRHCFLLAPCFALFPHASRPGRAIFYAWNRSQSRKEKKRMALVYFCKVLTGSSRNETLLKGFYCRSSRVWEAEEEKGQRWCFPIGRSVAGAALPAWLWEQPVHKASGWEEQ